MEEPQLYAVDYSTESLFWSIFYLNAAAFRTPLRRETRTKLLELHRLLETELTAFFDAGALQPLVAEVAQNNALFIDYVDATLSRSPHRQSARALWRQSGQRIAGCLAQLSPSWRSLEWSAMIAHQCDLLEALTRDYQLRDYPALVQTLPVTRRLAQEISDYLSAGLPNRG